MNYVQLPGEEHLDMSLTWAVAMTACEHLGGTLNDLFRHGWEYDFPSDAWESLWLIVGPPLSRDLVEIERWFSDLERQARKGAA